jgi:carbon-monoxide dehydrogenase iron sulfur subunit
VIVLSTEKPAKIPMQIVVNRALPGCTGCRVCEKICAIQHEQELNPEMSRIKVYQFHPGPIDVPIVCQNCLDKPCVEACPTAALHFDPNTGQLAVDEATCTACKACNQACIDNGRGGCITFHPVKGIAQVCDLCAGDPQCAKYCPARILMAIPASTLSKRLAKPAEYVADLIAEQFHPAGRNPF